MSGSAPDDHELEQLFADEAELTRRYSAASQDEPPVALDELVRAAARRQTRTRPRLAGSPFMASWRIPLSIAAVVVVSATVTVIVAEREGRLPFPGKHSAPAAATGEASNQAEAQPAPHALESQAVPVGAKAEPKARLEAARTPAASEAPAATPLERGDRSAAVSTAETRREPFPLKAGPAAELPAPAQAPVAPTASATPQPPSPATAPTGPAPPSSRAGTLRDFAREQERAEQAVPGAVPQDEALVGEAPASKAAPVGPMHEERGAYQPAGEERARAQALAKKQTLPAGLNSEATASPWEKDPQAWLVHIDELRTAGRSVDAKASFRAFRSHYPDYRLPAGFVVPGP